MLFCSTLVQNLNQLFLRVLLRLYLTLKTQPCLLLCPKKHDELLITGLEAQVQKTLFLVEVVTENLDACLVCEQSIFENMLAFLFVLCEDIS